MSPKARCFEAMEYIVKTVAYELQPIALLLQALKDFVRRNIMWDSMMVNSHTALLKEARQEGQTSEISSLPTLSENKLLLPGGPVISHQVASVPLKHGTVLFQGRSLCWQIRYSAMVIVYVTLGEGRFRLGERKPGCQPWPHGHCVHEFIHITSDF